MPITLTKTAYSFSELSDEAKEKAIDWQQDRASTWFDDDSFSYVYEDFIEIAKRLGLTIATRGVGQRPAIYWSGFHSQGDGACFEGRWSYTADAVEKIKDHAPLDEELHEIAQHLVNLGKKVEDADDLECDIFHSGHYYHERSMSFSCWPNDDIEDTVKDIFADLASWLYGQIEAEYEYQTSREAAIEYLENGDDLFNEDGTVCDF